MSRCGFCGAYRPLMSAVGRPKARLICCNDQHGKLVATRRLWISWVHEEIETLRAKFREHGRLGIYTKRDSASLTALLRMATEGFGC